MTLPQCNDTCLFHGLQAMPYSYCILQVTLLQSGGHLYHGQQSLRYVGRLQDHGTNLTCTVVQLDHLGTVLYSSTISLQLEVSELVIYSQGSGVLEERIGIISGIILAVIFIILIFILTALLLTRRRKKVKLEL